MQWVPSTAVRTAKQNYYAEKSETVQRLDNHVDAGTAAQSPSGRRNVRQHIISQQPMLDSRCRKRCLQDICDKCSKTLPTVVALVSLHSVCRQERADFDGIRRLLTWTGYSSQNKDGVTRYSCVAQRGDKVPIFTGTPRLEGGFVMSVLVTLARQPDGTAYR